MLALLNVLKNSTTYDYTLGRFFSLFKVGEYTFEIRERLFEIVMEPLSVLGRLIEIDRFPDLKNLPQLFNMMGDRTFKNKTKK